MLNTQVIQKKAGDICLCMRKMSGGRRTKLLVAISGEGLERGRKVWRVSLKIYEQLKKINVTNFNKLSKINCF